MVNPPNSTEERMVFVSRFMKGCFSSPGVVEEEVPDSGSCIRKKDFSSGCENGCRWDRHFLKYVYILLFWYYGHALL